MDVEAGSGEYSVIDGGPYLNEMGIESLGDGDAYVRRTTNGFLVIPKDVASKEYADIKTKEPESVTSLIGKIEGVSIPLGGRLLKPATALISEGDTVAFGQKIGEPVDDGFSIGVWSGMHGEVTTIEEDIVQISGGGVPLEDAEAETEAEAAR
jgi:Na+-translocating ferredoxin:NAD+ oxidoreductase RnfC subunit